MKNYIVSEEDIAYIVGQIEKSHYTELVYEDSAGELMSLQDYVQLILTREEFKS